MRPFAEDLEHLSEVVRFDRPRLGGGEMQLKDRPERLPHSSTLQATRVR